MIVGGCAAGMSAALAAAEKGHDVTLYEQSDRLGGQLYLAGAPPGREEFSQLAKDLAQQVALQPIRVVLCCTVDAALLGAEKPDGVILATGGAPLTPPIVGADLPQVVQAWDLLAGRAHAGEEVVIIGGGAVGVETALLLAEEGTLSAEALKFLLIHNAESPEVLRELAIHGSKKVTIVELLGDLGKNFGRTTRWGMLQDLERYGVKCRTGSRALAITANGVRIEKAGMVEELPADTVVLAAGTRSYNPLAELVATLGISFAVVGDARAAAMVFDAVHQGHAAGAAFFP
jgi:2,4-dienoyl-CoA reductase (NADPH2)